MCFCFYSTKKKKSLNIVNWIDSDPNMMVGNMELREFIEIREIEANAYFKMSAYYILKFKEIYNNYFFQF